MRIYLIAGEASGDLHGANLIHALRTLSPALQCRGLGGDRMAAAGMELLIHYRQTAYMGFWEVARHLPDILKALRRVRDDMLRWQPDAVVLIDYPGFNLRMARWAHEKGFKVIYYISPQLWAWNARRVNIIRKHVNSMLVILPFEEAFYRSHGIEVVFVGHPLLDAVAAYRQTGGAAQRTKLIAVLPGSRRQEVAAMLPAMLQATRRLPDYSVAVAGLQALGEAYYRKFLKSYPQAALWMDATYPLLAQAELAVVSSGTATLETALFDVPQVVCYRGSWLSYQIARRLVRVPFISLVNLIVNRPLVRELIQHEMTADNIASELCLLAHDGPYRSRMQQGYAELRQLLGEQGASQRAAQVIADTISKNP